MPTVARRLVVPAPAAAVWDFVTRVERWMPALEGYRRHETLGEDHYVMFLEGSAGVFRKVTPLEVQVVDRAAGEHIAFRVIGRNDPIRGDGGFRQTTLDAGSTAMDFTLTLSGHGVLGPVIDVALSGIVARAVDGLADFVTAQFAAAADATSEEGTGHVG